jgi:hypothetical protein
MLHLLKSSGSAKRLLQTYGLFVTDFASDLYAIALPPLLCLLLAFFMGGNQSTPDPPEQSHATAPSIPSPLPANEPLSLSGESSATVEPGITVVNSGKPSAKQTHGGDGNVETSR